MFKKSRPKYSRENPSCSPTEEQLLKEYHNGNGFIFVFIFCWFKSLTGVCFLVVNSESCSWSVEKTWSINCVWGIDNQTLSMVTLSLRPVVPWASPLGAFLWFESGLCWDKWLWRWRTGLFLLEILKNGGEKKRQWALFTRARQHVPLRGATSAFRNAWVVCHGAGGNAWNCPGLYEGSSCRLCCWYLEIYPFLTWCCFNCSVGSRKIYGIWW